jgi:virulence-associated protein VagC
MCYTIPNKLCRELCMIAKVGEQGLLIPKEFLAGVDEVEIRQENNTLRIVPVLANDPIMQLGSEPIEEDITDASVNHDQYLYKL